MTMSDVKALNDSFTVMGDKLTLLNEQMAATLEQVDKSVDTLTVRVERGKIELEQAVNEAFSLGSSADASRSIPPIVANSNQKSPEDFDANWLALKMIWDQTKFEVDNQLIDVAGTIADGRRRKRYENLNKRNYENVIYRLLEDNWISSEAADALLEMNLLFNSRKNKKRPVTSSELQDMLALQARWHANHVLARKAS